MWSARRYSNYIGSPDLFRLTKESFLAIFRRPDVPDEELSTFADWLAAIVLANQAHDAGYPLTASEARSALRQAGARSLTDVARRERENLADDEKGKGASGYNHEAESTDASERGALPRSSDEAE
jgi:hypothetical protein